MRELEGRVAVVTGAASGIGEALAHELARRGARLLLLDVAEERLAQVARGLGATAMPCDVRSNEDVRAAADRVAGWDDPPALLFVNAGVASVGPALTAPEDDVRWVFDVNVLGTMRVARAFAPAMMEAGSGGICFTASVAGLLGAPGMPVYSASKHAVVGFADALRVELLASGVTVTTLCPGFVRTGLHAATRYHEAGFARFLEAAPDWLALRPEGVARAAVDATLEGSPQLAMGWERHAVGFSRRWPRLYARAASALGRRLGLVSGR